jgi:amidohydrolase
MLCEDDLSNLIQSRASLEKLIDGLLPEIVEVRRDIHQHPELACQEHRTSEKVASWLANNDGISIKRIANSTGVVGLLNEKSPGKTVALRADMDALPIIENTGASYASVERGRAHSCGHDGHTAVLMGTAKVLSKLRSELHGKVKFVFQPAEESGSTEGASRMVKEGVLNDPRVDAIFALHSWPALNAGEVGVRYGVMMANTDTFKVTLYGRGGHAARPEEAIDPIVMSAKVIESIQTIISRGTSPLAPAVITVGKIEGGSTSNVIPDSVSLLGTVRTLDDGTRTRIFDSMKRVVESTASMFRAPTPELEITKGYPATVNNDKMASLVERVARELLGEANVKTITQPTMGGEDFSYYLQNVPGAMFRLGVASSNEDHNAPLHSARFNFNDDAIRTGILVMTGIVFEFLNNIT